MLLVDAIRGSAARVAEQAQSVRIDDDRLREAAERLDQREEPHSPEPALHGATPELHAAFAFSLAAINFGSGWWPTIRKPGGQSGYYTIATAFARWFDQARPHAGELAPLRPQDVAGILDQDPGHDLMGLYAAALADVGERVESEYAGAFMGVVDAADGSAGRLVEVLAGWPAFVDVSTYRGVSVPFFKRAQLAAADLHHGGAVRFPDLHRLTLFADNLVPHVLRVDGVLRYAPELAARIDRSELLEHGSPEEVEIRACAVHAVERMAQASGQIAADIDRRLWHLGQAPRYKSRPRHRARCTAY